MSRVIDAVVRRPKLLGADATVADARHCLAGGKVHAALVVDGDRLLTVIVPEDVLDAHGDDLARDHGRIEGRTVSPAADLEAVRNHMVDLGIRRLAVVDDELRLIGLLALKRSSLGFCSDEGIAARAAERATPGG